jgi:NADH dehydrogenase
MPLNKKTEIVIIGSGFGGVYSYKSLQNSFGTLARFTIISKTSHFLFTPMLHEAATLKVSDSHLVEDVARIIRRGDNFIHSEVKKIELRKKLIITDSGPVRFDYLVIAAGAETNFAGVPGAKKYAYGLKTYTDLLEIRERIISCFRSATVSSPSHELHFVIAGGGGTGVEMAAELAEMIQTTFRRHFGQQIVNKALVTIVHRGTELLADFQPELRSRALKILNDKGIDVMLGTSITRVLKDKVGLSNGKVLHASTVIWTAGIRPVPIRTNPALVRAGSGHFLVNNKLQLPQYPYVFAIGDIARRNNASTHLPSRAQVASKQGSALGPILKKFDDGQSPGKFSYKSSGELISLGEWYALGTVLGVNLIGAFAWYIRRTVYLLKMISFRKKLRVSFDWTTRYFYRRELIPD